MASIFWSSRTLMIGWSRSWKSNPLLNQINHELDIDRYSLHRNDLNEAKYQLSISNLKGIDLKHFNDFKDFIEYSKDIQDVYINFEGCNPNRKQT